MKRITRACCVLAMTGSWSIGLPLAARAQGRTPTLWDSCPIASENTVELGSAPRGWVLGAGSQSWVPLPKDEATQSLASRAEGSTPGELVYCVRLTPNAFPNEETTEAAILSVATADSSTLVGVSVFRETTPSHAEFVRASDTLAPYVRLLLPGDRAAQIFFVVVTREDAGAAPTGVQIRLTSERLGDEHSLEADKNETPGWFVRSLADGHTFRYGVAETEYEQLLTFAECDWLSSVERGDKGCVKTQLKKLQEADGIYQKVSTLVGRSAEREFRQGTPRASLSEPMVVFFGLSGLNRILLLDCRATGGSGGARHCAVYSEPWITTFQRARYFWAVYIEDEQVPFDTSIDVEFKSRAPSVDYESYDPRNLVRSRGPAGTVTASRRVLRVGYQRFRVREAPLAIQVAFTRQGGNYGLRQWMRVYREFSERPWVVSGALFIPGNSVDLANVQLNPILPVDNSPVRQARIAIEQDHRQMFATLVFRWPSVRGRAENEPTPLRRLAVNATPDVMAGLGLPFGHRKVGVAGFSWPFLWDRFSFTLGWQITQEESVATGFTEGEPVPFGTAVDAVSVTRWHAQRKPSIVGISIELIRSR